MTLYWRSQVLEQDLKEVEKILSSSGFFLAEEIKVGVELVLEHLQKGEKESGYSFLFAHVQEKEPPVAFSCFGPIPCTIHSFDLYWIAVLKEWRNKGLGKILVEKTEEEIQKKQGKLICIETSSKELYIPTQNFYKGRGYVLESCIEDFYAPKDNKLTFIKRL